MRKKRFLDDWSTYVLWYKYKCPYCGAYIREGDKFCHRCDTRFSKQDWIFMNERFEQLKDETKDDILMLALIGTCLLALLTFW